MSLETRSPANRSLPGTVLVATPFIRTPPYQRSVVLVVEHGERGSFGLVFDNKLRSGLAELEGHLRDKARGGNRLTQLAPDNDAPESDSFDRDSLESDSLESDSLESDSLESDSLESDSLESDSLESDSRGSAAPDLRFFVGAVVWQPQQLERELDHGIWLTTSAHFNSSELSDDLWVSLLNQIGRSVVADSLHLTEWSAHPEWN